MFTSQANWRLPIESCSTFGFAKSFNRASASRTSLLSMEEGQILPDTSGTVQRLWCERRAAGRAGSVAVLLVPAADKAGKSLVIVHRQTVRILVDPGAKLTLKGIKVPSRAFQRNECSNLRGGL